MMMIQSLNENSTEQLSNPHRKRMRQPFRLNEQIENGTSGVEDKAQLAAIGQCSQEPEFSKILRKTMKKLEGTLKR